MRSAYAHTPCRQLDAQQERLNGTSAHALSVSAVSPQMLPASAGSTWGGETHLPGLQTQRHTLEGLRRSLQTGQWGSLHRSPQFCWTVCALSHSCRSDQLQPARQERCQHAAVSASEQRETQLPSLQTSRGPRTYRQLCSMLPPRRLSKHGNRCQTLKLTRPGCATKLCTPVPSSRSASSLNSKREPLGGGTRAGRPQKAAAPTHQLYKQVARHCRPGCHDVEDLGLGVTPPVTLIHVLPSASQPGP